MTSKYKIVLSVTVFIVFLLITSQSAEAIDYNDNANGNWGTSTTWLPNGIPVAGDTVTIDSNTVTLDANCSAATLTVSAGGTLNVGASKTITVSGTLTIDGGAITGTNVAVYITAGAISQTSGTISNTGSYNIYLDGAGDFQLGTITAGSHAYIGSTTQPSAVTINGVITAGATRYIYIYSNGDITQQNNLSPGYYTYLYPDFDENSVGQFVYTSGTNKTLSIYQKTAVSLNNGFTVTGYFYIGATTTYIPASVTIGMPGTPITISATSKVSVRSNGNITVSAGSALTSSANALSLQADYDNNLSGDISLVGTASLPNGYALTYQQASTITYNNGLTNLTGCTTGLLTLTSTNGSVNITQATTGNSSIYLYANGASNTIGNVTAGILRLYKKNTDPTFTINDSSTINLTTTGTTSNGLHIDATATLNAGSSTSITTGAAWGNYGTFNGSGSTVTLNGSGVPKSVIMTAGSFNNLVVNGSGVWTPLNSITVGGTLQMQLGTFNANTNTVTATGLATLSGGTYEASTAKQTFNGGLTISGGTLTASSGEVEVNGTLTISNGTFTGSSGELDVNGDVALSGTGILTAPSGTFGVSGNWSNSGTFTCGTGTVTFDGAADQTLSGTLIGATGKFFNLIMNNTGASDSDDVILGANTDIAGTLTLTDGDLNLGIYTTTLDGDLSYATAASIAYDTSTFVFNGVSKTISGTKTSLILYNVTVNASMSVTDNIDTTAYGTTFTVNGTFTVGDGKTVTFSNSAQTLAIGDGGLIQGVDVADSIFRLTGDSTPTITLTGTGNFGNLLYLRFYLPSGSYTMPSLNYRAGMVEVYGSSPSVPTVTPEAGTLDIDGNLRLYADSGSDLDFSNSLNTAINIEGSFTRTQIASGTAKYTKGTTDTITFDGATGTQSFDPGASSTFNNITHSGASTLQLINTDLTVAGNWANTGGTFDANGRTVTFNGTNQALTGSTTFYNLTKSVTTAYTLTFDNTATQTITNTLTLNGAIGQLLSLRSDAAAAYNLTLQAGGTQSLSYLDVQYSDASGGLTLAAGPTSTDSTNNTNWTFKIISVVLRDAGDTGDYTTWAIGSGKTVDTVYLMDIVNCVLVKNDGNVIEDFSIQVTATTNWTVSTDGTNDDPNEGVFMGLFNGDIAPVAGDFSTTYDLMLTTVKWATESAGNGIFEGTNDGDSVAAGSGEKLYIYLETPSSVTSGLQETITVTIGCQEHP